MLHKMLITPLYRIIGALFQFMREKEKKQVIATFKKDYKSFCYLPKGTPNDIISDIAGNVEQILKDMG